MQDDVLKDYIQKQLYQKGIDIKTQDYITDYIHMNQKLFGNTLNINKIVDRILNNLESSIKTFDRAGDMSIKQRKFYKKYIDGMYESDKKRILINPVNHNKSYLSTKHQKRERSTIMHEIDHAATTTEVEVSEEDKDKYIERYLDKYIGRDVFNQSNLSVDKKREDISRAINENYYKNNKKVYITGIFDVRKIIDQRLNLRAFNEGITAYKQELYDIYNGVKPKTFYRQEKKLAKQVAETIGKENLISKHFDGDYEEIRQMFYDKTGQDLNYLVEELNNMKKIRNPVSSFVHKVISKIKKHNAVKVLAPARENINNSSKHTDTLQDQLAKQVNTPNEILMKYIEDITNQRSEINLKQQEPKKETENSKLR